MSGKSKRNSGKRKHKGNRTELRAEELAAIVERAKAALSEEDYAKLKAATQTLTFLTLQLEAKGVTIARLRRMLFGPSTEKTSQVVGPTSHDEESTDDAEGDTAAKAAGDAAVDAAAEAGEAANVAAERPKAPGHGRNGAKDYLAAEKVKVPNESLRSGDLCPACEKGKVYLQTEPAVLVRVTGMAPLTAKVYELERLRCNLCGEVFTAETPEGVGPDKYDETAAGMIAMFKYGCGVPFNRLEHLEDSLGTPLPAATQWDVVHRGAGLCEPAYAEVVRQAAQGEVLHNDDTTMKILELDGQREQDDVSSDDSTEESDERTGVFTPGIVSSKEGRRIALFFTGRRHAGENLSDLLTKRAAELSPPIQMCDALSRNTSGDFETIVASCVAHARHKFVDVAENFPDEVRHVLEVLRNVYKNDADAHLQQMTPEQRLRFHQARSGPLMDDLKRWLEEQTAQRKVEPNSGLGQAIKYMTKHWEKLTLFLREPGAPLDNNLCERALKRAILHRKNALFYRTQNGARVGDLYMTLIHTAELSGANPFDYLVALQRNYDEVTQNPARWMPWNYAVELARLAQATPTIT